MREILFKAKRIDNEKWVEGSYLYCKKATTVSFRNEHYILVFDGYGVAYYEIDKDTICQYTGLTDKNGNKIWEKDVVNVLYSSVSGEERYANGYIINDLRTTSIIGWLDYANEIEVIGNIFDNPELMEGK